MGRIIDNTLILNEIKSHFNFKNDAEFARFLEIKPNTLSNWYSRNSIDYQKIITKCVDIDANWLLTGEGSMLKEKSTLKTVAEPIASYRKTKDKVYDLQRVPLFNLEATMGLVPVVNNNGLDEEKIIDYISIPAMAICDGAIYASGDSMYPLLKAGDMVAYKKIDVDIDNIFFGEIYILALYIDQTSTMKTIKFVQKSDKGDDYIRLVSQNPHHADKDIRLNQIAAMGLVRASIRLHN